MACTASTTKNSLLHGILYGIFTHTSTEWKTGFSRKAHHTHHTYYLIIWFWLYWILRKFIFYIQFKHVICNSNFSKVYLNPTLFLPSRTEGPGAVTGSNPYNQNVIKLFKLMLFISNMSFFKKSFHSVYFIGTMPRFVRVKTCFLENSL